MGLKKKIWQYKKSKEYRRRAEELFGHLGNEVLRQHCLNQEWSACLSLLDKLSKINELLRPKLILEFGSGISTLLLSHIKGRDTVLVTIDEDMDFLKHTQSLISNSENIVFIHAPASTRINYRFFFEQLQFKPLPELIIIDGPAGERFLPPALELYKKIITPSSVCVIDDTDRNDNDQGAQKLAAAKNLVKKDYSDRLKKHQKFSVLFPQNFDFNALDSESL